MFPTAPVEDLVREIDNKINGSGIRLNTEPTILKEKEIIVLTAF
jgi:hypothetical protein